MVFWCGGVLAKDYFFNRVSEGTLDSFLVRFRGVSVLHCHGVLVWRRAVFSTGGSTTGKGWQNWQKTLFLILAPEAVQREKVRKIGKRLFLILAPEAVQREKVRKIGKRLFLIGFQKGR